MRLVSPQRDLHLSRAVLVHVRGSNFAVENRGTKTVAACAEKSNKFSFVTGELEPETLQGRYLERNRLNPPQQTSIGPVPAWRKGSTLKRLPFLLFLVVVRFP